MKFFSFLVVALIFSSTALADSKFKFNFINTQVTDVVSYFSQQTGESFTYDGHVQGKVTILNPKDITRDEAFIALLDALKSQNYTVVSTGRRHEIMTFTNAVTSNSEVARRLPQAKPAKVVTYVFKLKKANAEDLQKTLRPLTSRQGDITPYKSTNSLMITDWTDNIVRMAKMIEDLEK